MLKASKVFFSLILHLSRLEEEAKNFLKDSGHLGWAGAVNEHREEKGQLEGARTTDRSGCKVPQPVLGGSVSQWSASGPWGSKTSAPSLARWGDTEVTPSLATHKVRLSNYSRMMWVNGAWHIGRSCLDAGKVGRGSSTVYLLPAVSRQTLEPP